MKKERTIQKGNVKEGSFDVRIIESNGKTYYYHFLELTDGEQALESQKPINLNETEDILWDNLPFTVKEVHCKKIYPNYNLDDYETRCLLYGKEQTDQALSEKRKKEEREIFEKKAESGTFPIDYYSAMEIYDRIGPFEKVEVVQEESLISEVIVDDEHVIKLKCGNIISIETKQQDQARKREWGRRINEIAQSAETTYDIATVVANFEDDIRAVTILKEIIEIVNDDKFDSYMKKEFYGDYNSSYRAIKSGIHDFLYDRSNLPTSLVRTLNISKRFCNAVKEILNNK